MGSFPCSPFLEESPLSLSCQGVLRPCWPAPSTQAGPAWLLTVLTSNGQVSPLLGSLGWSPAT